MKIFILLFVLLLFANSVASVRVPPDLKKQSTTKELKPKRSLSEITKNGEKIENKNRKLSDIGKKYSENQKKGSHAIDSDKKEKKEVKYKMVDFDPDFRVYEVPKAHITQKGFLNDGLKSNLNGDKIETVVFVYDIDGKITTLTETNSVLSCCEFIEYPLRWRTNPVIKFDTSNLNGLTRPYLITCLNMSNILWSEPFGQNLLLNGIEATTLDITNPNSPNGENEAYFAQISSGTIAVTIVHFGTSNNIRQIIEADMIFNANLQFGDATVDPGVFDFQSVGAHELGHFFGLGHPPATPECSESTMYYVASTGEIIKRDPTDSDYQCILALYDENAVADVSNANLIFPGSITLAALFSLAF